MLIASKYEEITPPKAIDFCQITDNTYEVAERRNNQQHCGVVFMEIDLNDAVTTEVEKMQLAMGTARKANKENDEVYAQVTLLPQQRGWVISFCHIFMRLRKESINKKKKASQRIHNLKSRKRWKNLHWKRFVGHTLQLI